MASSYAEEQWIQLKKDIKVWIDKHPTTSIDELLASWLDDSGSLAREYQVFL